MFFLYNRKLFDVSTTIEEFNKGYTEDTKETIKASHEMMDKISTRDKEKKRIFEEYKHPLEA